MCVEVKRCSSEPSYEAISQKFGADGSSHVHNLQYFDKDWNAFIDIEDSSVIPDKSHLKCSLLSLSPDVSQLSSISIVYESSDCQQYSQTMSR